MPSAFYVSYVDWDTAVELAGLSLTEFGWMRLAREFGFPPRPPGPNKYASPRCESGRKNYCTCDTCF